MRRPQVVVVRFIARRRPSSSALVRLCTLKGDGAELQNETRTLRSLSSFSLVITTLEASMPTFTVAPAHEQRQGQHSQLTKQA